MTLGTQDSKIPLAIESLDELTVVKNKIALIITPKVIARITTMRQAGFVTSPISCKAGKDSKAIAIEKRGAPIPTKKPIRISNFLFLKIPLI